MPLVFQGDNVSYLVSVVMLLLTTCSPQATAQYVYDFRNLVATFGFIIATQYLVVFVLLVFFYWKILSWIRQMRKQHSERVINSNNLKN